VFGVVVVGRLRKSFGGRSSCQSDGGFFRVVDGGLVEPGRQVVQIGGCELPEAVNFHWNGCAVAS
jgi:hypothetical protein